MASLPPLPHWHYSSCGVTTPPHNHNPPTVTQENERRRPHKDTQQSWWAGHLHFYFFIWDLFLTYIHSQHIKYIWYNILGVVLVCGRC